MSAAGPLESMVDAAVLARRFGVSSTAIRNVRVGVTWRHRMTAPKKAPAR